MAKELKESNQADFAKVHQMITEAKSRVWQQVNKTLIQLYWSIGQYVSNKITHDGWGKGIVEELADYISIELPTIKGFSARNIRRMNQFYETYHENTELSVVLTEITWTNHLHILSKTKSIEEKEFYLRLAAKHHTLNAIFQG
ncbi:DUF1016 N-terminal domain-containing protein [Legionella hackeliae]|uniref:YhcG N-terminal domain-containing protein n=1 Tax=Legionella hackeliae TaxID=449 RepID=A0A0A8UX50_LEGHA|nr:DUF1016 N-terminal domain-containing protein [Legionella hackeliae]KTD10034.1 hypothetical protein Lhac_2402 [Legionella hackeliae]CEK11662.1 conserved protein of unknown function [Legionella hackeliae]STX48432.1 protein of uncharacterised function DUF1016 [Legionella hackeliae]